MEDKVDIGILYLFRKFLSIHRCFKAVPKINMQYFPTVEQQKVIKVSQILKKNLLDLPSNIKDQYL